MPIQLTPANSDYGQHDATYRAAGGEDGIRRLVDSFYAIMQRDAQAIRDLHPQDLSESKDKLTLFLCGWMGGPKRYQQKYGAISIPGSHAHLNIGEAERDSWLDCMRKALATCGYPQAFQAYLLLQLSAPAERIRQVSQRQHGG